MAKTPTPPALSACDEPAWKAASLFATRDGAGRAAAVPEAALAAPPFSDADVERQVRRPDGVPPALRLSMEAALQQDASARRVAAFYRDYYTLYDALPCTPSPQARAFTSSLFAHPAGDADVC